MVKNNHDLSRFLILAAVALVILLLELPRMSDKTGGENHRRIFAETASMESASGEGGKFMEEKAFARQNANISPCDVTPRVAIFHLKPFDLNQADIDSLTFIRGVGPKLAARIIARREELGGFREIEELLTVRGLGAAKLEALKEATVVCR